MRIRISVAGLANTASIYGAQITITTLNPGKWIKEGQKLWTPFGEALKLTPFGLQYIKDNFRASDIHNSDHDGLADARFEVPDAETAELALKFFEERYPFEMGSLPPIFEDPIKRIRLSLQGVKLKGLKPILSREEADKVEVIYQRSVRQQPPIDKVGTSTLAKSDAPTLRLFYKHILVINDEVIRQKLLGSLSVQVLTPEEVATTLGGTCKGNTVLREAIGDNVFD